MKKRILDKYSKLINFRLTKEKYRGVRIVHRQQLIASSKQNNVQKVTAFASKETIGYRNSNSILYGYT